MEGILTFEQTRLALGVSEKTLRRMIRAGLFPDSFPVSPGKRVWLARDVDAYLYLRSRIGGEIAFPDDEAGDKEEDAEGG